MSLRQDLVHSELGLRYLVQILGERSGTGRSPGFECPGLVAEQPAVGSVALLG